MSEREFAVRQILMLWAGKHAVLMVTSVRHSFLASKHVVVIHDASSSEFFDFERR
jgi:hypothetical protein